MIVLVDKREMVSIHAPREGCDLHAEYRIFYEYGFNSRTPGGVRQILARGG